MKSIKKIFKHIIIIKNVIFNISLSLGNISTSNTQNKNINEININLGVKDSYDNIYNVFLN